MLQRLDLSHVEHVYQASKQSDKQPAGAAITPLQPTDVRRVDDISDGEEMRWGRLGARLIAEASRPFAMQPIIGTWLPHQSVLQWSLLHKHPPSKVTLRKVTSAGQKRCTQTEWAPQTAF